MTLQIANPLDPSIFYFFVYNSSNCRIVYFSRFIVVVDLSQHRATADSLSLKTWRLAVWVPFLLVYYDVHAAENAVFWLPLIRCELMLPW